MQSQIANHADLAGWAFVLAAMLPGMDGNALLGAFGGAVIYALKAKDEGAFSRGVHILVSVLLGYHFAPDVHAAFAVVPTGAAALGISLLAVTAGGLLIDTVKALDLAGMINRWLSRRQQGGE